MRQKKKPEGEGPMNMSGWDIQVIYPSIQETALISTIETASQQIQKAASPLDTFEATLNVQTAEPASLPIQKIEETIIPQQKTSEVITTSTIMAEPVKTELERDIKFLFTEVTPRNDEFFMPDPPPIFPTLPAVATPAIPEPPSLPIDTPAPYLLPTPFMDKGTSKNSMLISSINSELSARNLPLSRDTILFMPDSSFLDLVTKSNLRANLAGRHNTPIYSFSIEETANMLRVKGYRPESDKKEMVVTYRPAKTPEAQTLGPEETIMNEKELTSRTIPELTYQPILPAEKELTLRPIPELPKVKNRALWIIGAGLLALMLLKK